MRGSAAFRTGVAPGGALAGPWTRNPLWASARAVPSLDLRFADNKSLTDATTGQNLVTFTRASSGTYVASDGVLRTAANDVPRFDHNPTTGESLGLLVEEQRTNSIRNNTMVGAVAGTPGTVPTNWSVAASVTGLSSQIIETGTESGIAYIDIKWTGTPSANGTIQHTFESNTNTAAVSGQSWTATVYHRLVGGVVPGATGLLVVERSAANAFLTSSSTTSTTIDSGLIGQRITHARTLNNASTAFVNARLDVSVVSGVTIDFTLRIGLPQLEQGAFATSVIPTTTTALTRSADVASITGSNFSSWYRQDRGTLFSECLTYSPSSTNGIWAVNDNTSNNRIDIRQQSSSVRGVVSDGGVAQATLIVGTGSNPLANTIFKTALAYLSNDFSISQSGLTAIVDSSGTIPVATQSRLGQLDAGSSTLNGTIRRLTYWPVRLGNNVLQQITQ